MSDIVIKVENLSKQYRLGTIGTGTLSHDLNRWWYRVRGKEDPYTKVTESNDRTQKGASQYVWALKDINLELERGNVLGIIGKNGAGKSTLLKIFSRVTAPTQGAIFLKGKLASLLEVGTGFHPELTGRENVFLNGAILGMSKAEIEKNFDAIVDFSGVERYIDTPAKRYSSGMYVRLAFAVAAYLDPEILLLDEVLAVGDIQFQNKCIAKIREVSKSGRTVIFVSHNMQAVRALCSRAIVLSNGQLVFDGATEDGCNKYMQLITNINIDAQYSLEDRKHRRGSGAVRFDNVSIVNEAGEKTYNFDIEKPIIFRMEFVVKEDIPDLYSKIVLNSSYSNEVVACTPTIKISDTPLQKGRRGHVEMVLQDHHMRPGEYPLFFWLADGSGNPYDELDNLTLPLILNSKKSYAELGYDASHDDAYFTVPNVKAKVKFDN